MLEFEPDRHKAGALRATSGVQPATSVRSVPPRQHHHVQWHLLRMQTGIGATKAGALRAPKSGGHAGNPAHIVIGYFDGWHMRGAAVLREFPSGRRTAEIVLSVESAWQGRGYGTALMAHALRAARERGIEHLYLTCHALNHRTQRIAERFGAKIGFDGCECFAEFLVQEAAETAEP